MYTTLEACDVGDVIRSHENHPSAWEVIDAWYDDAAQAAGMTEAQAVQVFELRNLGDKRTCRAKGSMGVWLVARADLSYDLGEIESNREAAA